MGHETTSGGLSSTGLLGVALAQGWQYASLDVRLDGGVVLDVVWQAPGERVTAASYEDFLRQMDANVSSALDDRMKILTVLGSHGWELVMRDDSPSGTVSYIFKRPAR